MSSSMMMMERTGTSAMPGSTMGSPMMSPGLPAMTNYCMVPRCEIKLAKCAGGFKMTCSCDDEVACGALQNLCKMLAGSMCSCCCTMNGMTVCQCNLCVGNCKCEVTKDGCCITCTSGDKPCCEMLQACCECMSSCREAGCCCTVSFGNTPVCCGTCSE